MMNNMTYLNMMNDMTYFLCKLWCFLSINMKLNLFMTNLIWIFPITNFHTVCSYSIYEHALNTGSHLMNMSRYLLVVRDRFGKISNLMFALGVHMGALFTRVMVLAEAAGI
jgi:hypothetical protein